MVILKGVLLHILFGVFTLGLLGSAMGAVLNSSGNATPFWILMGIFVVAMLFVKEAYRHLK